MARRPIEASLYTELIDSRLEFLGNDPIKSDEIYNAVKNHFPNLCDDTFICPHHSAHRTFQPEWQHVVRQARNSLKLRGLAQRTGNYAEWIFLPPV